MTTLACQLANCDADAALIVGMIHGRVAALAKAAPVAITGVIYDQHGPLLLCQADYLTDAMRPVSVALTVDLWRAPRGSRSLFRWTDRQAQKLVDAVTTGRRAFAAE